MKKFSGNQFSLHYAFCVEGPNYCKPRMKGGHTHNHQRNALKRMRRCRSCDKPITKYEGFKSHFSGHICMECHVENCLEHASMVGISIQWPLFEELYNPYIRRK